MPGYFNDYSPLAAWGTFARYVEERERGLAHTPEWVERMTQLEADLRATQDDLRLINAVAHRPETARGEFDVAEVRS